MGGQQSQERATMEEAMKSQNNGEQEGKADYTLLFDDFQNCHAEPITFIIKGNYRFCYAWCLERTKFADFLKLREFGAQKYSRFNWKASKGTDDHDNFMAANKRSIYRHLVAHLEGETIDPESGCLHLACVALRCMIAMEYEA